MAKYDELKRLIATSYGESDKIFANHVFDIKQSQLALIEAFRLGLGFKKYIDFHKQYLLAKGVSDDHLKNQLKEVKKLDRYFDQD